MHNSKFYHLFARFAGLIYQQHVSLSTPTLLIQAAAEGMKR